MSQGPHGRLPEAPGPEAGEKSERPTRTPSPACPANGYGGRQMLPLQI